MKRIFYEINGFKLFIGYFDPFGVAIGVDFAFNLKSCLGCCRGDQIDNYFMANEWLTSPILTYKRK